MAYYVKNLETNKIELHFDKNEYHQLDDISKKEIKTFFNFSRYRQAWVSKAKNHHYTPISIAEKLKLENKGEIGEPLSFEEELERMDNRAYEKLVRFQSYLKNSEKRQEQLQSEFRTLAKDWAWLTQPNVNTSSGRAFTRQREKVVKRFEKGFEEMDKQAYFKGKIASFEKTIEGAKFSDPFYLGRRIDELTKHIKKLEEVQEQLTNRLYNQSHKEIDEDTILNISSYGIQIQEQIERYRDRLNFFIKRKESLNIPKHSKKSLAQSKVTHIQYRKKIYPIKSFNQKTVTVLNWLDISDWTWLVPYYEIQRVFTATDQISILDRNNEPVQPKVKFA